MNNNHLKTDVAPANAENMETEVSAHTNLLESPDVSEASETSKHGAAAPRKGWLFRELFEWGETLISALIIIVVVFTFALRLTSVDGGSMLPTLKDEDQLLITNFFYTPKRGDIVVIYAPYLRNSELGKFETYGKDIIKRVIAVEGDVVEIDSYGHSGNVRLNGVVLDENYVSSQTYMNGLPIKVTVGKGQVLYSAITDKVPLTAAPMTPKTIKVM